MKRLGFLFLLSLTLVSCATSTITRFHQAGEEPPLPATKAADVGIYRSLKPFDSFTEIGVITFRSYSPSLSSMYDHLRRDAGAQGAEAVVDLRIDAETHLETEMVNKCIPTSQCNAEGICMSNDQCHLEPESHNVSTYTVFGSMIRRKP